MFVSDNDGLVAYQEVPSSIIRRREEIRGSLSDEQFDLLIELSSIHSRKIILAMRDHLVKGDLRKVVCQRYNVNAGYLSVCIGRLLRIEQGVSRLARFYCQ
uniref:adhesin biosynthesis transcription regulatory family protein n=1 Tax=Escherichia marmotae TaxID=1499973 RepID=UPI001E5139AF|nr:adhesin biosynthesis transcription regulatory family protein [Escherichia marmotae]